MVSDRDNEARRSSQTARQGNGADVRYRLVADPFRVSAASGDDPVPRGQSPRRGAYVATPGNHGRRANVLKIRLIISKFDETTSRQKIGLIIGHLRTKPVLDWRAGVDLMRRRARAPMSAIHAAAAVSKR